MKLRPYVAFETPADQGTGTPPAPPEVPAAPAPPATPAPTPDAPWAADLASVFQDEAERARVDQFMREKYQPYVTQLEQKHAPARQLYDALQSENSLETYLGLAEQLYGEEAANYLAEKIIEKYGEEAAAPAEPAPAAGDAIPFEKLPPEVQERMRKLEADEARTTYWAEMG